MGANICEFRDVISGQTTSCTVLDFSGPIHVSFGFFDFVTFLIHIFFGIIRIPMYKHGETIQEKLTNDCISRSRRAIKTKIPQNQRHIDQGLEQLKTMLVKVCIPVDHDKSQANHLRNTFQSQDHDTKSIFINWTWRLRRRKKVSRVERTVSLCAK